MPALLVREILIRKSIINGKAWLNVIIVAICLAFSASGENAEAFLGMQVIFGILSQI
ncbi:MAG: putative membrane protein [Cognaticolwellia sp.]